MEKIRLGILVAVFGFCVSALTFAPNTAYAQVKAPKQTKKPKTKQKKPAAKAFRVGPNEVAHYVVDDVSKRNEVTFTSKAPRETIKGKADRITGHLDLNPRKLDTAEGRFVVPWGSVDTGNQNKNQHMRSPTWVDAASYPDIVFTITGIEAVKARGKSGKTVRAKLVGTWSMNGHEKDIKVSVTLAYVVPGKSKKTKDVVEGLGIRATFKLALSDFGIEGRGRSIGSSVAKKPTVKIKLFLARTADDPEETATDGRTDG